MKRAIGALLGLLALAASPTYAQTIKLATIAPKDSPYYDILRDMGEAWRKASGGQIELRIYPDGVAGDESDVVRKMRVGQLQASAMSGGGLTDIVPEYRAMQMPMMFASEAERDYVAKRLSPKFEALLSARGFKILGWSSIGSLYFFTQKPVVTPEDLKPLAIFAWAGNTGFIDAWKRGGFRPVALPATEIMTGLQSGLINAVTAPPLFALSAQWFALAPHMMDIRWASLGGAIIVSKAAWDRLPETLKPKLKQAAEETCRRLAQNLEKLNGTAIEVMKKHGLVIHHVGPDQYKLWESTSRAIYPYLTTSLVPAELVREVEKIRDEYRAAHPQP